MTAGQVSEIEGQIRGFVAMSQLCKTKPILWSLSVFIGVHSWFSFGQDNRLSGGRNDRGWTRDDRRWTNSCPFGRAQGMLCG